MKEIKRIIETIVAAMCLLLVFYGVDRYFGVESNSLGPGVVIEMIRGYDSEGANHVLIIYDEGTAYVMEVSENYWKHTAVGDRVPLRKTYGLLTGWEWDRQIQNMRQN